MRPKKIILCVDDNEQDLSVLKFMLVTNGYRVLAATNGNDAIALFADNQVDLVLTDHAMPQMSGMVPAASGRFWGLRKGPAGMAKGCRTTPSASASSTSSTC